VDIGYITTWEVLQKETNARGGISTVWSLGHGRNGNYNLHLPCTMYPFRVLKKDDDDEDEDG